MNSELPNIYVHQYCGVNAIGNNTQEIQSALLRSSAPTEGTISAEFSPATPMFFGAVKDISALPNSTQNAFKCRNNALIYKAFCEIKSVWEHATKAIHPSRIAIIIGSSNAGIEEGEKAIAEHNTHHKLPDDYVYGMQEYGSPARFLATLLNTQGPAYTISTACSSSAKAFISAARLLQANVCDIALVGGSDTLSQLTVHGFSSLEAIDGNRSQPFAEQRKGIHLGEAAALFILSREPSAIKLAGWGESSDAHHMAAPQPDGLGAEKSMRAALSHASIKPEDIDYINLHGTATTQNDSMEAAAVARLFGEHVPVSSTKSLTGHTLGASGATEALFCCLTLAQNSAPLQLPRHWINGTIDPVLPKLNFVLTSQNVTKLNFVLSNSFGFGGSNATVIFEKVTQ